MDMPKREKDKHLGLRIDSELHYKLHYISQYLHINPEIVANTGFFHLQKHVLHQFYTSSAHKRLI